MNRHRETEREGEKWEDGETDGLEVTERDFRQGEQERDMQRQRDGQMQTGGQRDQKRFKSSLFL